MGKKTGVFEEGQHVFARIRGHPFWPACVSNKSKAKVPRTGNNEMLFFVLNNDKTLVMRI